MHRFGKRFRRSSNFKLRHYPRFLANDLVSCDTVMQPFASEILARLTEGGDPVPLILDQSKVSDRHQVLMLSVRWGERALPVAWRVEETDGAIGFAVQKDLLDAVRGWLFAGTRVVRSCSTSPAGWRERGCAQGGLT